MADELGFVAIEEDADLGFQPAADNDDLGFVAVEEPASERTSFWNRITNALGPGLLAFQRANIEASKQIGEGVKVPPEATRAIIESSPVPALLLDDEVKEGLAEGSANVLSSLPTRENVALGALTIASPAVGAGVIAGLSAKSAGEKFGEASVAIQQGDKKTATRDLTEGGAAVLGVLAPLSVPGVKGARVPPVIEAATPEVSTGLKTPTTATPATEPIGITPSGSALIQRAIEYFKPASPEAPPELRIDTENVVPRLQPYETEKLLAVQPNGMANVPGLGALVDPRATAKTAPDVAIITRAHSVNKGRTLAALWAEGQFRNKDLFKAEKDGTIALENGERGYISDVIEAEIRDPGSQAITPAQRDWINNEWLPLREDVNKMLTEEGVREVVADEFSYDPATDYFPRPAVGKVNRETTGGGSTGGRPGAAPFYEKARRYETEFEGARPPRAGEIKEQIIYDPDAISRATKFIVGAYKSVADHRLANDAALGGETVKSRFETLVERNRDRLDLLDKADRAEAEAQLRDQAAYPIWGKEEALHIAPAFQGKIYPIESAQRLRKAYADEVRGWVKGMQTITSATKAMMATADVSAPVVQGAAMMGRHPTRWAKATAKSFQALFDPHVVAKVLENPVEHVAAQEFAQSGGTLLQLQDFISGKEAGAPITRIPGYGKVVEATGRAYGTFLDLAKLELWKAWKDVTPRDQWGKLAESIETSLFSGRMENIGLNPHRTVGERLMMFAPMYYRGAGNLIANAFQRGINGKMARQMLAGYATAGLLVTVGSWVAMGLSEDEIEKRLDPRRGTFMKMPVPTGDGGQIEVGFGNILTQLTRLIGQAASYHLDDKPIDTGVDNNPYLKFLRGRSAFLPSLAIDIATGTDYMGNPITIKEATARRFMPFVLQSLVPREETSVPAKAMDAAFSFMGLNAFPESEYATQLRHMDQAARSKYGAPIFELPLADRAKAVNEFKLGPGYKDRDPTMQDMRRFLKLDVERRAALRKALNENARTTLDKLGVDAGSFKSTLTVQGVDVPLSRAEQRRYQELLAETFNERLKNVPDGVTKFTPAQRDKWWEKYAAAIRKEAREKMTAELVQKQGEKVPMRQEAR